jgi:ribosomal protein S18 acetylase RimI-like enzyme
MRWMARLTPLVWWWSQVDPAFRDAFNGFVWEEREAAAKGNRQALRTVGNVSLSRAPGDRKRWIICNVVVAEEYRGRGIGRQMVQAAVEDARSRGAAGVLLQVHQDNVRALQLYTDMGFGEVAGEVELRLMLPRPVAVLDAPGHQVRPWRPADGGAAYALARRVVPQVVQWMRPLRANDFRLDWLIRLARWMSDVRAGRRVYRLSALRGERLVALVSLNVAFRQGDHSLNLLSEPDHRGQVEAALISRALHLLEAVPSRAVRATVDQAAEGTVALLRAYGFEERRRLLTLRRDFR